MNFPHRSFVTIALATVALAVAGGYCTTALAQENTPLYKQAPYDVITLNAANDNQVYNVKPLDFPGRTKPANPKKSDRLKITLVSKPDDQYTVLWASIDSIVLFEEMVLAEANDLTTKGNSELAYETFQFLRENHADLPGLEPALQRFLFFEAGRMFQSQRQTEALAILEELYRKNPAYESAGKALPVVMGSVIDQIMTGYTTKEDYNSARKLLARLIDDYGKPLEATTEKWRQRMVQLALAKKNEAISHGRARRFREANNSVKEMMRIWPDLEGAAEFARQVSLTYPLLIVGVSELPAEPDPLRLDSWPERRAGRLRYRTLLEFTGQGPEGGEYTCPFGTVRRSNDGRKLFLEVVPEKLSASNVPVTGFEVADQLISMTNPVSASYQSAWSELATTVDVEKVMKVEISLREAHLMPEAYLLQKVDARDKQAEAAWVPYLVESRNEQEVRYLLNPDYGAKTETQPREIIEQRFEIPELAVEALLAGDIDIIDRLPPRAIPQLRNSEEITLRSYVAPTIHLLTVNMDKEYLANRTFRRAILTAIDREAILEKLVLEEVELDGYKVLSGPFPAGASDNDPLAYAYDNQIPPQIYSPPLAAVLSALAQREMELIAEKKKIDPPEKEKLILVHPDSYLPSLVCDAIAKQLNAVGIECETRPLPPGVTRPTDDNWHLNYAQLVIREPIVDARRDSGAGRFGRFGESVHQPRVARLGRLGQLAGSGSAAAGFASGRA